MRTKTYLSLLLPLLLASAAFPVRGQAAAPGTPRELIHCAGLMSPEERAAYRSRMQSARSVDEKESLRAAHRRDMQERARASGRAGECEPARRGRGGPDK